MLKNTMPELEKLQLSNFTKDCFIQAYKLENYNYLILQSKLLIGITSDFKYEQITAFCYEIKFHNAEGLKLQNIILKKTSVFFSHNGLFQFCPETSNKDFINIYLISK